MMALCSLAASRVRDGRETSRWLSAALMPPSRLHAFVQGSRACTIQRLGNDRQGRHTLSRECIPSREATRYNAPLLGGSLGRLQPRTESWGIPFAVLLLGPSDGE